MPDIQSALKLDETQIGTYSFKNISYVVYVTTSTYLLQKVLTYLIFLFSVGNCLQLKSFYSVSKPIIVKGKRNEFTLKPAEKLILWVAINTIS